MKNFLRILSFYKHTVSIMALCISISGSAIAGPKCDRTDLSKFSIGYSQVLITDNSRNLIGGSTPTATNPMGRQLIMRIWYPSNGIGGTIANYALTNPIYNGLNFPGVGYPLMQWNLPLPSPLGAKVGVPIVPGSYPLMMLLHGNGAGELMGSRLGEIMASQGYIFVQLDSTGNDTNNTIAANVYPGVGRHSILGDTTVRAMDVEFALDELLHPTTAISVHPQDLSLNQISQMIQSSKIGLYGYSAGGTAAMKVVTGSSVPKDNRITSVIFGEGYSVLNPTQLTIPSLFLNVEMSDFSSFVNSNPKYVEYMAGAGHYSRVYAGLCADTHQHLLWYQDHPDDLVNYFYSLYLMDTNIYAACDASVFDGLSNNTLDNLGISQDVAFYQSRMPFYTFASVDELTKLSARTIISFANLTLKNMASSDQSLTDFELSQIHKNCIRAPNNPMDLKPGDKLVFRPTGNHFKVSISSGNSLNPVSDTTNDILSLGDDDFIQKPLQFNFPLYGNKFINNITIGSNGFISEAPEVLTPHESEWATSSYAILANELVIAALGTDLDPTAGGAIYFDSRSDRAIITYDHVPVYTDAGDGATNTVQVVLNKNGTIEIIFGQTAGVGPDYRASEIGLVGVSVPGVKTAIDMTRGKVDFSKLTKPTEVPNSAVMEYFHTPTNSDCN